MIKKQHGVTLIELLVSMLLAVSLAAGLSQLFVQSQSSFKLQRNLSDITDDASFILESLAKGVHLTGYLGTSPLGFPVDINVLGSHINLAEDEYIHGTDNEFVYRFKLGVGYDKDGKEITNSCTIKTDGTREGSCVLDNFIGTGSLSGNQSDIVTVRIFMNDPDLRVFYSKSKINSMEYPAQPLISEVEKLEIHYVIRNDDIVGNVVAHHFYTTTAANVSDWSRVFAIKVYLVLRSTDDKLTKNKITYKIQDTEYKATDNRLYKVFSRTIKLRSIDY